MLILMLVRIIIYTMHTLLWVIVHITPMPLLIIVKTPYTSSYWS